MTVLAEGNLQITVPNGVDARKFDDAGHGLSHCMKAVDFIFELADRYLFVEFKDPDHPQAGEKDRAQFISLLRAGGLDEDLKYKYRDSFLYQWALGMTGKPVYYYVLVAAEDLTTADLSVLMDKLKRNVPSGLPDAVAWTHPVAEDCGVFNIESWNRLMSEWPVKRVPP